MSNLDPQLLAALRAAEDAGDTDAAQAIAAQIHSTPVTPQPDRPQPQAPAPEDRPGGENWNAKFGPTAGMSGPQKYFAGMGQSIYDTGRGLGQLVGMYSPQEVDAQRAQDAPLDKTGAGMFGNLSGGVMTTMLPGAGVEAGIAKIAGTTPQALAKASAIYRMTRPVAEGAALGATGTVGSDETRAENTALGGVAGGVGGVLGKGVDTLLRAGTDNISKGARIGADIAQKYGIPLSMPDLAGGSLGWMQSALDKLPFSGAYGRANAQREAFNNALGKTMGVNADGAITQDVADHAQDTVGNAIGQIASKHQAIPTTKNMTDMMAVLNDARANATPENAAAVYGKIQQLLAHVDPNTGTIPGDAWRQANTALGRQIRSTTDGDLRHYFGQLQEPYMDMMEQGMPQGLLDTFQGLRGQYKNIKTLQPLALKAGNVSDEGINPALVQGRAIAAGNVNGDVKELGDFAKKYLVKKYPDSGTAQRALLYTTLGGLGVGANELFGGAEGDHQHEGSAAAGVLSALSGELGGGQAARILGSRALSRYYTAQLPGSALVRAATDELPVAATRGEQVNNDDSTPQQPLADGGTPDPQYKKSTFWDLVQQAIKEVTGNNSGIQPAPAAPAYDPGNTASGPAGSNFDRSVDAQTQANE